MSRDNIFWGVVLLVAGSLFLASNLGYLAFNLNLLWPLFIIALGLYILLGRVSQPGEIETKQVTLPLDKAKEASIHLEYGAGSLRISGAAAKGQLLAGEFNAMQLSSRQEGSKAKVKLHTAVEETFLMVFPWNWNRGRRSWDFSLNPNIPIKLKVESGASENKLDLSELQVVDLDIDTGASSTTIIMPKKAGHTKADISGGAASFDITIPKGVAAKIRVDSGLGSISVDEDRFPRVGKGYQSANYEKAANTLDLRLEIGVSSIKIR
ncbi:MAG TPA: toast rack family protein [Anaerolineales bacterium]